MRASKWRSTSGRSPSRNFAWDRASSVATNRSRVLDLAGVQFVPFPISGGNNGLTGIQAVAMKGQPLGVYYGTDFIRCGRGLSYGVRPGQHSGSVPGRARRFAVHRRRPAIPRPDVAGNYVIGDPNPDWTGSVRTVIPGEQVLDRTDCSTSARVAVASNQTRGALDHFGTSKESQVMRDGGNFVFGDTYFSNETRRRPRRGHGSADRSNPGLPGTAASSTAPSRSSTKTPASSSSAKSRWATPSTSPGSAA